jgi:hypothetical protein
MPATALPRFPRSGQCAVGLAPVANADDQDYELLVGDLVDDPVVPIEDFNVLEDAIDRYFSREADRDLAESPDARTYSMSEAVAAIFGEDSGQSVA